MGAAPQAAWARPAPAPRHWARARLLRRPGPSLNARGNGVAALQAASAPAARGAAPRQRGLAPPGYGQVGGLGPGGARGRPRRGCGGAAAPGLVGTGTGHPAARAQPPRTAVLRSTARAQPLGPAYDDDDARPPDGTSPTRASTASARPRHRRNHAHGFGQTGSGPSRAHSPGEARVRHGPMAGGPVAGAQPRRASAAMACAQPIWWQWLAAVRARGQARERAVQA